MKTKKLFLVLLLHKFHLDLVFFFLRVGRCTAKQDFSDSRAHGKPVGRGYR